MITLNGEKELTRIHDWADILARPGFDGKLDPNAHELEAIIAVMPYETKSRAVYRIAAHSTAAAISLLPKMGAQPTLGRIAVARISGLISKRC